MAKLRKTLREVVLGDAFLDKNGLLYFWQLVKGKIPTKTSDLTNDSNFITDADIPEGAAASNTPPKMDGVQTVGTETTFARGDHIHPSDTSKVDKEEGKQLSTEDYTTAEKSKLSGIEEGAEVNVIETVQVNGSEQTPSGKTVNISVPTTVAQLTDSGNYALKTEIPTTVAQLTDSGNYALKSDITNVYKYKGSVDTVSSLPSEGNTVGDIYNVEDTDMNYAWNGEAWDPMGSSFTITAITNEEIDQIMAS